MALRAIGGGKGAARGLVRGIVGLLPGGQVATSIAAIRWGNLQSVIVVDVALRTSHGRVSVGERESGGAVVEGAGGPAHVVVATTALCNGEALRRTGVRRIIGLLPGSQVAAGIAAVTVANAGEIVVVIDVTLRAWGGGMCPVENKTGGAVIEGGCIPAHLIVTGAALRDGKALRRTGVGWIIRLLVRSEVAVRIAAAIVGDRSRQIVVVVDVAGLAGQRSVRAHQGESSVSLVIEGRAEPAIKLLVALLAVCGRERRTSRLVCRVGGLLPILQVAGVTVGLKAIEDADGGLLVALFTRNRGMRTQKREAVHVILHLLYGNIPALDGVALLAVRAHLPAMHISVAIGAILADIGENRLDVTGRALHLLVHSAQRIFRFVVIEFRNRAHRLPGRGGMAVFAWNVEGGTVGAVRDLLPCLLS